MAPIGGFLPAAPSASCRTIVPSWDQQWTMVLQDAEGAAGRKHPIGAMRVRLESHSHGADRVLPPCRALRILQDHSPLLVPAGAGYLARPCVGLRSGGHAE